MRCDESGVTGLLELKNIFLSFDGNRVLKDCSLSLSAGTHVALMGPSGCGKTTLLRIVLGLQLPDAGTVKNLFSRPAFVFQEPRLLPWCTAEENVNFVLSDKPETMAAARSWLEKLELHDAMQLFPSSLSGGMQQRVSIARALASTPDLLLLDEPFKGMDEPLRYRVTEVISRETPKTAILLATHSEEEADALGCKILHYQQGRFVV